MPKSSHRTQRCPCGANSYQGEALIVGAVCLQLSTVGITPRRRAPAVTIYVCAECARLIHTKRGRALRRRLAEVVQQQAAALARQKAATHAA